MKQYILVLLLSSFFLTSMSQESEVVEAIEYKMVVKLDIRTETFKADTGWGYNIFLDGQQYIHQDIIPSVPEHYGFKSEEDAAKTAQFVANKIRRNIIPPSVTPQELDSLGVYEMKEK
ncbi:MAG: hypothetical protein COB85_07285 [Bacteroidetes bacterium]|nr:MAG: hypothetical protein COB85_07285 [Bacteroidota bacterium]